MAADALKQRLVGGATLLLVALIAWFWLLSADSPVDPVARESQIPPAPDIKPFAVSEPSRPQNIEPIGSAREAAPALQSDAVPAPDPVAPQTQKAAVPAPASKPVVTAAPPPKPAQAAQVQKVDTAKVGATNSAVGKSNAAAASALSAKPAATAASGAAAPNAPAPKAAPLKTPAATTTVASSSAKAKAGDGKDSKLVPETFQLDQHGLPVAWVVQVGLFSTQASADKIKATLQGKGFKAYTEPFKSDKASGVKVFVGPKLSRERADAQKKAVDELLKTNTMVVRFVAN